VKPLTLTLSLTSTQLARRQGDTVIVEVPKGESLSQMVSLPERKLPLQTNYYLTLVEATDEIVIPVGYKVEHMPPAATVDNAFFRFERTAALAGDRLKITMRFTEKTTLVQPDQSQAYREAVNSVVDNLKQDVVLVPAGGTAAKKKAPPPAPGKAP
jgi:hypothetical protein